MKYRITLDFGPEEPKEPLDLPDPATINFGPPRRRISPEDAKQFWDQHKDDPKLAAIVRRVLNEKLDLGEVWFAWRDDPRIVERGFDMLDVIHIVIFGNPDIFRLNHEPRD